tara:strand:- start:7138 stop:8256 length:1119 start_codon:yes stop_codon:yes gene_type:complete
MVKKDKKKKSKKPRRALDVNEILLLTLGFIGKKLDDKGKIVNKKKKSKGGKVLPDGTYFGKAPKKRLEDKRTKNPFGRDRKSNEKLIITQPKGKDESDREYQQRKRTDDIINITADNPIAGLLVSNLMGEDFSEYSGKNYSDSLRNVMAISEKLSQGNLTEKDQIDLTRRLVGVVKNIPKENRDKVLSTNQGKKLREELGFETDIGETVSESDPQPKSRTPTPRPRPKKTVEEAVMSIDESELETIAEEKRRGVKTGTKRGQYRKKKKKEELSAGEKSGNKPITSDSDRPVVFDIIMSEGGTITDNPLSRRDPSVVDRPDLSVLRSMRGGTEDVLYYEKDEDLGGDPEFFGRGTEPYESPEQSLEELEDMDR